DPRLGALAAAGAFLRRDVAAVALAALQEALVAGRAHAAAVSPVFRQVRLGLLDLAAHARPLGGLGEGLEVVRRGRHGLGRRRGEDVLRRGGVLVVIGGAGDRQQDEEEKR